METETVVKEDNKALTDQMQIAAILNICSQAC